MVRIQYEIALYVMYAHQALQECWECVQNVVAAVNQLRIDLHAQSVRQDRLVVMANVQHAQMEPCQTTPAHFVWPARR